MSITMSNTDKLEIRIMDRIDKKVDEATKKFEDKVDKLQVFITESFEKLESKYETKESMRPYKIATAFIGSGVGIWLINFAMERIFK